MNDRRVRTTGLDCFACGHSFQTASPAGSMASCPECGVPQVVPGRAVGNPKAPKLSKPLASPAPSATRRGPAPPVPAPGPPGRGASIGARLAIGALLGILVAGAAGYVWLYEPRHKGAATPSPEIADTDEVRPSKSVEVARLSKPPGSDASRRPPPMPKLDAEPEPVPSSPVVDGAKSDPESEPSPPSPRPLPDPSPLVGEEVGEPRPRPGPDRPAEKAPTPSTFRHPRTAEEIRSTLTGILEAADEPDMPAEVCAALRRLKAYRYLAGLPYREIALDADYNERCVAAADVCRRLGRLTHTPENPGLPEKDFEKAKAAAGKSNLAFYRPARSVAESVDSWMGDSDDSNIDRLGHRRWCLNPSMRKTGFGRAGEYSAMWVVEDEIKPFEDFRFVGHPAPGYMPVDYFDARDAWSVTLNPRDFRPPRKEQTEVRVYPVRDGNIDRKSPLELDYFNVENSGFGVSNCIIFRPRSVEAANGRRYWVEVKGLQKSEGAATELDYLVEFFR